MTTEKANERRRQIMKIILILTLLALPVTAAQAACWERVSESTTSVRYIDACSIARDGQLRKAWIKSEYSNAQSTDDYPAKNYIKTMQLNYYNCFKRQDAATQGIYYSESGKIVKTESIDLKKVIFVDTAPGTVGEAELDFVCKPKSKKPSAN